MEGKSDLIKSVYFVLMGAAAVTLGLVAYNLIDTHLLTAKPVSNGADTTEV